MTYTTQMQNVDRLIKDIDRLYSPLPDPGVNALRKIVRELAEIVFEIASEQAKMRTAQ